MRHVQLHHTLSDTVTRIQDAFEVLNEDLASGVPIETIAVGFRDRVSEHLTYLNEGLERFNEHGPRPVRVERV